MVERDFQICFCDMASFPERRDRSFIINVKSKLRGFGSVIDYDSLTLEDAIFRAGKSSIGNPRFISFSVII